MDEVPAYLPSGAGPHLYVRDREARPHHARRAADARARARSSRAGRGVRGAQGQGRGHDAVALVPGGARSRPARARVGRGCASSRCPATRTSCARGTSARTGSSSPSAAGDLGRARDAAAALASRGLPNFFGPQRFGTEGRNAAVGRAILLGDGSPEARRASRDRFLRRLSISAYQSLLFNRWLAERMADGLFATAIAGDVLKKLDTGGLFNCADPAVDGPRVRALRDLAGGADVRPQAAGRRGRGSSSRGAAPRGGRDRALGLRARAVARRRGRAGLRGSASRSRSRRSRMATSRRSSCRRARTRPSSCASS